MMGIIKPDALRSEAVEQQKSLRTERSIFKQRTMLRHHIAPAYQGVAKMGAKKSNKANSARINKRKAIIILAIAAAVIVGSVTTIIILNNNSQQQTPQFPWLFNGAYAIYNGTYMNGNLTLGVSTRIQVVSYNSTIATVIQNLTETFVNGTQVTGSETSHYDLQNKHFILDSSYILNGTYAGEFQYNNEIRPCTILQYVQIVIGGAITYEVYYDNATSWILKQTDMGPNFNSSVEMVSTNIPGF